MLRIFSKDLQQQTLFSTDRNLNLRTLFIIKQASVGADFFFYVIGGSSLLIICLTILYLVYRKRQMSNFYGLDPLKADEVNKDNDPNKENEANDKDAKNGDNQIDPKANIDEDDEIKVQDKTNDVPLPDPNDLSVDRSKRNLIGKSSTINDITNSPNKSLDNISKGNEKEEEEENERAFSERSQVSKLSAHKIVVRNCQKDLVCFTNEHRSEPDVEILNNDFLKNNDINENNEDKLSAEDIESISEEDSSYEEDDPNGIVENKGPIDVSDIISDDQKKQDPSPISKKDTLPISKKDTGPISNKLSIKEKRRISDFDEETKDQIKNFVVFKQGDVKKEVKTQISNSPTKKSSSNQIEENNQISRPGVLKNRKQSTNIISRNTTKKGK
jgi:hypothetical protein